MKKTYNILFLCTSNSARSILAEALATTLSHGRFIGYSAGSKPSGQVHPMAAEMVKEMGYPMEILRSKSWDEYGAVGAPKMDFILTLCDAAAGEDCPYWAGHPATAHWGFADPTADNAGEEAMLQAFKQLEMGLRNRLELMLDLSDEALDHLDIQTHLHQIHRDSAA
jgi:arsenate reductase